jgi:hypothetical protein
VFNHQQEFNCLKILKMPPRIAGVYDKKNEEDEDNKLYVGGADGRGGGSGLNVIGPPSDDPYSGIKQNASSAER